MLIRPAPPWGTELEGRLEHARFWALRYAQQPSNLPSSLFPLPPRCSRGTLCLVPASGACARRHADRKAGEAHIKCSGGPHPRRSGAAFFVLDLVASTERESTRTPTRRGGGNTRTSLVGAREVRFSTVTTRHSGYTVSVDTELDASNAFLPSIRAGPGLIRILCGDCFQLFTD